MTFKTFLIVLYVICGLATVLMIDVERKPVTRGSAALSLISYGLIIWGIVTYL